MQLSAVMSFVALVASASAVAIPNSTIDSSLTKRQTDACTLFCQPLQSVDDVCKSDSSCYCSGTVASLMYTCGTCGFQHDPSTYSQLQGLLDQYTAGCAAANYPIGTLPLPFCTVTTTSSA